MDIKELINNKLREDKLLENNIFKEKKSSYKRQQS